MDIHHFNTLLKGKLDYYYPEGSLDITLKTAKYSGR